MRLGGWRCEGPARAPCPLVHLAPPSALQPPSQEHCAIPPIRPPPQGQAEGGEKCTGRLLPSNPAHGLVGDWHPLPTVWGPPHPLASQPKVRSAQLAPTLPHLPSPRTTLSPQLRGSFLRTAPGLHGKLPSTTETSPQQAHPMGNAPPCSPWHLLASCNWPGLLLTACGPCSAGWSSKAPAVQPRAPRLLALRLDKPDRAASTSP